MDQHISKWGIGKGRTTQGHTGIDSATSRGANENRHITPTTESRCWCEQTTVEVTWEEVRKGLTRACHRQRCSPALIQ